MDSSLQQRRILAIDPGSVRTGYALIDSDGRDSIHVHSGKLNVCGKSLAEKLGFIFSEVTDLIREHQPDEFAIEEVFMSKNADSALKLGQARGSAICAAAYASLPVSEYSARLVKQAVVGTGAADKSQVQHMVAMLLKLDVKTLQSDQADALAIALCHAHSQRSSKLLKIRSAG